MDMWTMLIRTLVAIAGILLFLRVVAAQIAFTESALQQFDECEKKAKKRRLQRQNDAEMIEAELAARGDAA